MQIVRYLGVGSVAALVDLAIFTTLVKGFGVHYLVSGAVGVLLATAVNYLLSIRFVFIPGTRFGRRAELLAVYIVSGTGLLIHQIILYIGVDTLGQNVFMGKFAAMGVVFFWNYFLRKFYVFAATE